MSGKKKPTNINTIAIFRFLFMATVWAIVSLTFYHRLTHQTTNVIVITTSEDPLKSRAFTTLHLITQDYTNNKEWT